MRIAAITSSFLLAASAALAGPVDEVHPGLPPVLVGADASDNVELIAALPDVTSFGGKLIGDHLYTNTLQGLRIYDVSLGVPVLVGALELPHLQNEDIDTNGEILLISSDHYLDVANVLYVIDVSIPQAPVLLARMEVPFNAHTTSCIADCSYGWISGDPGTMGVVDLREPSAPKLLGEMPTPGWVHDVQVDAAGIAWVVGTGGIIGYDTARYKGSRTPPIASYEYTAKRFRNRFTLHNSWRPRANKVTSKKLRNASIDPGELVLVTEEHLNDLVGVTKSCTADGNFQTGWFNTRAGYPRIERLDTFSLADGTQQGTKVDDVMILDCSSHYFDEHAGVVGVAWYDQGVRFLDVSKPKNIRQIGYFTPTVNSTWAVRYHRGLWYVFDVLNGLTVLRFTGDVGDDERPSPRLYPTHAEVAVPGPRWGWICRVATATA